MACRFPGADGPEAYWELLTAGRSAVREVPPSRLDVAGLFEAQPATGRMSTRWAGLLDDIDRFDAGFFGISPREADRMDPQQRLVLEVGWEALEDAGEVRERLAGARAGVFLGISTFDYSQLGPPGVAHVDGYAGTGNALSIAANRLSYFLDARGPSIAVDTACSSSLVAVHLARASLLCGESDVALAGGVNALLSPKLMVALSAAGMMAGDGRCKTFDAAADGYVRGEGCGIVVLKRLADALRDGDPIIAVVRGSAINQDGRSNGLTAPSGRAQEAVLREALARAGAAPGDVGYVEAHGTGTPLGDPIEALALDAVLRERRTAGRRCLVGSVKTNLGHLEAAAGIAGLIKTALALRARRVPPTLHFHDPNPQIPFDELCLEVPVELREWPPGPGPATAGVSSFGFGGTNAHVVLGEAPTRPPAASSPARSGLLLAISAHAPQAARELAAAYAERLEQGDGAAVCATAALRRTHFDHRIAVTGATGAELAQVLRRAAAGDGDGDARLAAGARHPNRRPRLAFVFAGQGGPLAGAGLALARDEPVFHAALEGCDEIVRAAAGFSVLEELARAPDATRLGDTAIAQPVVASLQLALADLWRSFGLAPAVVLGHSLGELAAACVAGALTRADALALAVLRGRAMAPLGGHGAMLAVAISPAAAEALVARTPGVEVAAVNSPSSVVLSGAGAQIAALREQLDGMAVRCRLLESTVAFHSAALEPVLAGFATAIDWLRPATGQIPFVSTLTGGELDGAALDAAYWVRQARAPVAFADAAQVVLARKTTDLLELGAHPALLAPLAECAAAVGSDAALHASLRRGQPERVQLLTGLGALYVRGLPVRWTGLHPHGSPLARLPRTPWQRRRHWLPAVAAAASAAPRRLATAAPVYEAQVGTGGGHRVGDRVVVSLTAGLELVRAATAQQLGTGRVRLLAVQALRALPAPSTGSVCVQVTFDAGAAFDVHFDAGDEGWERWLSGRAEPGGELDGAQLDAIRGRCDREPALGPLDASVTSLCAGAGEALGRLSASSCAGGWGGAADAGLALFAPALGAPDAQHYVPVAVDRAELGSSGALAYAHAVVSQPPRRAGEPFRGDLALLDEAGAAVATLSGVEFRVAAPAAHPRELLYTLDWEPAAAASATPASAPPAIGEAAVRAAPAAAATDPRLTRDVLGLCAAIAARALAELDEDGGRAAVAERRRPLLRRVQEIAQADAPGPAVAERAAALRARHRERAAQIDLLERCGGGLAGVLRASVDPLALLMGDDGGALLERAYSDAPASRASNDLAGAALDAALDALAPDATPSVIELGAGTGGMTGALLARPAAERVRYVFTDVSPHFTARAAQRFGDRPRFEARVLDIERPPGEQGLGGEVFDVVVAANVLHATRDVRESLSHARSLLRAGGLLLVLEQTTPRPWLDLTFGLTDGWWRFADADLRRGSPLLDPGTWLDVLAGAGFEQPVALPTGAGPDELSLLLARAATPTRSWLLLADTRGVAAALARRLAAAGHSVTIASDVGGTRADAVVDLRPLDAEGATGALMDSIGECCRGTLATVQALAAAPAPARLWLVTCAAVGSGAPQPLAGLAASPLWGLGRTLAAEHPQLFGGLVDLEAGAPDTQAAALEAALTAADGEPQTALRDGRRLVARLRRREPADEPAAALRADGTYLVTGGLGAIGLRIAGWLAERGAGTLVLAGRSAPADEAQPALAQLRGRGSEVLVERADVSRLADVERLVAACDRAGAPLRGVVHAAGVFDDSLLLGHDWTRFERVLAPKVLGAWHLHTLTRAVELDLFVLVSSAASILGLPGLANYAAANAFLDALAEHRRALGMVALSAGFSPWAAVGMAGAVDDAQRRRWAALEARPLEPREALDALGGALAGDRAHVGVIAADWHAVLARLAATPAWLRGLDLGPGAGAGATPPTPAEQELAGLSRLPVPERRRRLTAYLRRVVAAILGMTPGELLDPARPLHEAGMDSLTALELRNRLQHATGLDLPATLAFELPTIDALAGHLAQSAGEPGAAPAPVAAPAATTASVDRLLGDLDAVSDAEALLALSREDGR